MTKYLLLSLLFIAATIITPAYAESEENHGAPSAQEEMAADEAAQDTADIEPAASEEDSKWEKGSNNFSATRDRGDSRDNQISADPDKRSNHEYMGHSLNR